MNWSALMFLFASLQISLPFSFLPTKTYGSVDLKSVVNHLTLMEQVVTTLLKDSKAQNTEISALKIKVGLLQSQLGTSHLTSVVNSLKDELFATKTELRSVSNEVISVNTGLKTLTSLYTNLQIQVNDTDNVVQDIHVSLESKMQSLNSSLETQNSTTQTIIGEISNNKQALEKVNASLLGSVGQLRQSTTKTINYLERSLFDLHVKFNSSLHTLEDKGRLLDNFLNVLNTTRTDTTLLKSDVTLMNWKMMDIRRELQTTSNKFIRMTSSIDTLNETTQMQMNATHTLIGELNGNRHTLETVNRSLTSDLATLKKSVTGDVQLLWQDISYLQAKVNSTQSTLEHKGRLLDKIAYDLNMTTRDTLLLKGDVTIMNQRMADLTRNMQTTSNTMSTLSSRISHMNRTVQTQTTLVIGQANQNTNSLRTFLANLATVNSTLSHSNTVLKTEVGSVVASVKDQDKELGAALKRFNASSKDASLLKTDVALLNSKMLTVTTNLQTTSSIVSRLSPIVDRLNVEVSFEVHDPQSFVSNSVIKFSSIEHNIGSGYHSSTGKFIAPVAGTYLFWAQIDKKKGSSMRLTLVTTGENTYSYMPVDGGVTATVIAAVVLGVGDTAHVETAATDIYHSGSSFGGILLGKH